MKCGFIGMTQKPRNSWLRCEDCGLSFSTFMELSIMNFFPQGQTANQHFYIDTLVLSDAARAHCAFLHVKKKVIPHPPNSSHLVFFEFSHFPRLKMVLEHRRFNDISITQAISWDTFAGFWTVDFTECFECWCSHWTYCIKIQENYFEGNGTD